MPLRRTEFLNTDGEHAHDTTVSSVSILEEGPIDFGLFQEWIGELIQTKGTDLYRMKGVLHARFATQKYVYHAVHMIFNGEFEDWDEEETVGNKLVFIGKDLDAPGLRAGFAACLATPENLKKKELALRFQVGDRVECNMSGGSWAPGSVLQLMWRDEEMDQGQVCPYKVSATRWRRSRTPAPEASFRIAAHANRVALVGRSSWTKAVSRGPPSMMMTPFAGRATLQRSARCDRRPAPTCAGGPL